VFAGGFALSVRFVYFWWLGEGAGHVQSVILAAVFLIVGFQIVLIGLLADAISGSRKLLEDLLYRVRLMELRTQPDDNTPDTKNGTPTSSR
jgi:hypothetical protein